MIIFWKNKGFLVILIPLSFIIAFFLLNNWLERVVGGFFTSGVNDMMIYGVAFIFGGVFCIICDFLTINNYKIEIDWYQINELYCISMRHWGYYFIVFGILNIIFGIIES